MDYHVLREKLNAAASLKGQEFFEGFFDAWGFPKATMDRIRANQQNDINKGISISKQAYILDTQVKNLYSEFSIILQNGIKKVGTRFIILSNDSDILAYDTETYETLQISKLKLADCYEFFFPLIGKEKKERSVADDVTISVAEKVAGLYNKLLVVNGKEQEKSVQDFICFLVFVSYTDDTVTDGKHNIEKLLSAYSIESIDFFKAQLVDICGIMGNETYIPALDINYGNFPHSTFIRELDITELSFTNEIRKEIIDIIGLDWSGVTPEVLGAILQDATRKGVSCYTTGENVHKVIGPLFLDELYQEYEECKDDIAKLNALGERVCNIHILDPACSAGNFLIVTYRELIKLICYINERIEILGGNTEHKFYWRNLHGIDGEYFAAQMARLSLLIAIHQTDENTVEIDQIHIRCVSPLSADWEECVPDNAELYIIGNPPYRGAKKQTLQQKKEKEAVFFEYAKCAELDYAASWFLLAAKLIEKRQTSFSFVTTNSLTQGEQVGLLWPKLYEHGIRIQFAYKPFKWRNDAKNSTAVTVVILGISASPIKKDCQVYDNDTVRNVLDISPYLTRGDVIVFPTSKQISNLPFMNKGNMAYDEGHLSKISPSEHTEILREYPNASRYFRKFIGADEFINGIERWCLWITNDDLEDALAIPPIKTRIDKCQKFRLGLKDASGRKLADRPHQFREMRSTKTYSLVVPSVSSENRQYMQIGFIGPETIVSNLNFVIYEAEPWIFGVIASKMHNLWIRTVCGGLETRLRYSSQLGYNTFPFPQISPEQKRIIGECVMRILAEREELSQKTYAQMYDEDGMSIGLKYEHNILDQVIEKCYREEPFISDTERMDYLFYYYKILTEKQNG